MSFTYLDANGNPQALDLSVGMYKEAADAGQSLPQYLATKYPTNTEKYGSAFEQVLEQNNIFLHGNSDEGIQKSSIGNLLSANASANAITKDGVAASRLLFPAIALSVIEDKLAVDIESDTMAFEGMIAVDDAINGERFERPVLHYPSYEDARSMHIAQLAEPNAMMSITVSDTAKRIPTYGIGLEISDQARNLSLDLVGLAIARQAAVERNLRTQEHILGLLNGDSDTDMVALSTISGKVKKAKDFDASITAAGELSQTAWLKWLIDGYRKRTIQYVITDIDTYLAWEARKGQPTSANNINGVNKPNSTVNVVNKSWPDSVQFFITDNPAWPAHTMLGIDTRYGIHRVKSLTADYSAVENFVMKRSTQMRFDSGELVYRLFDEAFEVLTLTV